MSETKAKRKLSNIDFSAEGAHVALVGKSQGGPANGKDFALVMKSANFSDEFIQKASTITVTLEITEFLNKFFYIYGSDAEVLARVLGFTTEMQDVMAETEDSSEMELDDTYENEYEKYIQSKVDSFVVMKSLHEADDITSILSKLDEGQYLSVLEDQSQLEKALDQVQKNKSKKKTTKTKTTRGYTADKNQDVVSSSVLKADKVITQDKDKKMQLEKALEEKDVLLQKALEEITLYKAKEKEAVQKARFAELKEAVPDEEKAKVLFKAVDLVQDQAEFTAIVKVLADLSQVVEKSSLFTELGTTVKDETPVVKESKIAKAVKEQLNKQVK